MDERYQVESEPIQEFAANAPVPAARPLSDFSTERVGDDVVVYDVKRIQYHTLNNVAYEIWRLCDGQRSIVEIGVVLASQRAEEIHCESIALATAQLEDAGLLNAQTQTFDVRIQRRRVLKLAAAGVITAVGVPVVVSITAPEAAAANTCLSCPPGQSCCPDGFCGKPGTGNSVTCSSDDDCCTRHCNTNAGTPHCVG